MIDISPLNIRGIIGQGTAEGPTSADDIAPFTTGTVYEVDPAKGRVRVGARGGVVWLPAIADRYTGDSLARILLDPYTSRPVLVAGAVKPRRPAELARITAGPTGGMLTVLFDDVSYTIPAPTGAYTIGNTAWVMLDEWGVPYLAIGPSSQAGVAPSNPGAPSTGGTVTATATIGPQWSGTWRQTRWNNYNGDRYGGLTNIYQGAYGSSGTLVGFATYGDQIVNLGAISIENIILTARKNDTNGLSAALAVQGSPHGAQPPGAPGSSGDVVSTGVIGPGATGQLAFSAGMREAFRTGAAKGLCAVGSQYGAFGGTATPGSFVLTITYTRNA